MYFLCLLPTALTKINIHKALFIMFFLESLSKKFIYIYVNAVRCFLSLRQ